MKRYVREISVLGVLLLLLSFLAWRAPDFFQVQPLRSLLTREAPALVVACGMALVIMTRQIDISVGSQFSVCSVVAGLLATEGLSISVVTMLAVALGSVLGALNGFLVAALGLPSIVVTLGTLVALRQGLNLVRQGEFVNMPDQFQWLGRARGWGQNALLIVAVLVVVTLSWALRHVAVGRYVYAVGSDGEAARLSGIRPKRVTFGVFVLLGALTGLAAVMNVVQSPQVQPLSGLGLELKVIAAAVVGVWRSRVDAEISGECFFGLLLLACVSPAMIHLRIEAYWEKSHSGGHHFARRGGRRTARSEPGLKRS
jgi:rhamnose transport system permease protein